MTNARTFLDLAERCEKAMVNSFALNEAIHRFETIREEFGDCGDDEIPDYGGSIDAASALIPARSGWNLQGNTNIFYAVVAGHYSKVCVSPGLALSAAALRARAAMIGREA